MDRLAITGLGVVSPIGATVEQYWRGLNASEINPCVLDNSQVAAKHMQNRLFYACSPEKLHSAVLDVGWSPIALNALDAVAQAIRDAKINADKRTIGLIVGTGAGEIDRFEASRFETVDGHASDSPYVLAGRLADRLGLTGPCLSVSTACSASAYAFLCARNMLCREKLDAVVICGAEAMSRTTLASFNRLMALDDKRCRPFDAERRGTVLGDGAAALVLERLPRGSAKKYYAGLKGIGASCDAYHPTAPLEDGSMIEYALRQALADSGVAPEQVGVIIPHGTGTRANDEIESQILKRVFGEGMKDVTIFPVKAKLGHSGGAAGAFSTLTLSLILSERMVPPISAYNPDLDYALKLPIGRGVPLKANYGVVNAYGFGGSNISLLLEA